MTTGRTSGPKQERIVHASVQLSGRTIRSAVGRVVDDRRPFLLKNAATLPLGVVLETDTELSRLQDHDLEPRTLPE